MGDKRYCMYFANCTTRFNLKVPNFKKFPEGMTPPDLLETELGFAQCASRSPLQSNSTSFTPPTIIFWIMPNRLALAQASLAMDGGQRWAGNGMLETK